jgi:Tfp pilus assembly protein PilF
VQQLLGEMLVAQGKRQEARLAFLAAKAANRTPGDADVFLAQLDIAEEKPDMARAAVEGVIAADPGNTRARFLLATLEEARGKYDLAAGHYRKILEEDPDNVAALNNLANVLADGLNNPAEALEYAQKAKEYAPYNADIEDTLGWVFYKKGLYTAAVRHLEMAVSRQATARNRCHLAMAYWQAGDHKRGRETLEVALRQDPKVAEGRQARQLLGVPD